MAIIRCPYCHAIIDENDKYCNNCGTQLLFTEDEAVEEEIPGEKIIDADVEEKDYTVDEPGVEKRPAAAKDLDTEIDEDLERELREETEEMALDELVRGRDRRGSRRRGHRRGHPGRRDRGVRGESQRRLSQARGRGRGGTDENRRGNRRRTTTKKKKEEEEKDKDEEDEEEDDEDEETDEKVDEKNKDEDEEEEEESDEDEEIEEEDIAKEPDKAEEPEKDDETTTEIPEPLGASGEVADVEYIVETPETDIASTAGESALRPLTFDTRELESIGETVDLGKEKVDSFVAAEAEPSDPNRRPPRRRWKRRRLGSPRPGRCPPGPAP